MSFLRNLYDKLFSKAPFDPNFKTLRNWELNGKPIPPPHIVKQAIINTLKAKSQYNLFVETGTYLGEMVEAQKINFNRVLSIELGENLFNDAVNKFKYDKNVTIFKGDSSDVLLDISIQIDEPAIFG
jgi:hypothetical protein